jgi:CRP-like cAMP-binding protein
VISWKALLRTTSALISGGGSLPRDCACKASETVVVKEEGKIWTMPAQMFLEIAGAHPEMAWTLTEELSSELAAAEAAIEVSSKST